ncbi:MAG TPA: PAS domain S-box protein, partial [Candidatus Binatia bacterium]|nr:PAS domain S-box protein [Candidatus Binatia bacterium]
MSQDDRGAVPPHTRRGSERESLGLARAPFRVPRVRPLQLAESLASATDAILTTDVTGLVTSWNQGAERLYEYSAEEIVGRPVDVLVPPDHAGEPSAIMARIQRGERVAAYDTVGIAKDGRRIDVSLGISPLYEAGRIAGALIIVRDITEQKRIEAELAELKNQLAADVATMTRLQEMSTRLVQQKEMTQLLSEILDAAMAITGADMGNIQLLDESSGVLAIKAQHGFDQAFLDFFARVHGGQAACGTA